jgi:cation:H+ antiporter
MLSDETMATETGYTESGNYYEASYIGMAKAYSNYLTTQEILTRLTKEDLKKDIPLNIAVTLLLIFLGMNQTILGRGENVLSRIDGAVLLLLFAWYLWSSFKSDTGDGQEEDGGIKVKSNLVSILMIIGGLAALVIGGRLFVNSATSIAQMFGVSDKFIAITIMAAGTSMPELATCVVAAAKGRGQLALGNVLGSNLGNILLILGGSALIHPLSFAGMTTIDLGVAMVGAIFIFLTAFMFRKKTVDRVEGAILLLIEAGYMWYLIANL